MSTHRNHSCGHTHSQAIKRSPGWARYKAERKAPPVTVLTQQEFDEGMERAESSRREHQSNINKRVLEILGYDITRIRQKISEAYRNGYVRALYDVKRERERAEAASYEEAMGSLTMQEAASISHIYDSPKAA